MKELKKAKVPDVHVDVHAKAASITLQTIEKAIQTLRRKQASCINKSKGEGGAEGTAGGQAGPVVVSLDGDRVLVMVPLDGDRGNNDNANNYNNNNNSHRNNNNHNNNHHNHDDDDDAKSRACAAQTHSSSWIDSSCGQ